MTPHKQLNRHRPEAGEIGDCWRTSIACLLDMHPREVPHFVEHDFEDSATATRNLREWLAGIGLGMVEFPFSAPLEAMMSSIHAINPGSYYLLSGNSRNRCGHTVVACGDKIVWDPSIDDSGIVGPMDDGYYWVMFFVPGKMVKR